MMAHRNGNSHRASRFSEEEIQELRYMFLTNTATEVAEHFNCNRSLVYKYVRQSPQRYRKV
jgi:DNA invertase Pin-like site-specific DNA recombinase